LFQANAVLLSIFFYAKIYVFTAVAIAVTPTALAATTASATFLA